MSIANRARTARPKVRVSTAIATAASERGRNAGGRRRAPPSVDASALAPVIARLAGWADGRPLVAMPDAPDRPQPARSAVALSEGMSRAAAERGQEVLVTFARGVPGTPIIIGLLDVPVPASPAEVVIDGQRLVLDAQDEIELRCGPASIKLQKDGLVVVKGLTVETRARGVNRIRGGSVKIN